MIFSWTLLCLLLVGQMDSCAIGWANVAVISLVDDQTTRLILQQIWPKEGFQYLQLSQYIRFDVWKGFLISHFSLLK